jgi:hypothetical protein
MIRPVPKLPGKACEASCLHCDGPLVPTDHHLLSAYAAILCLTCRSFSGYRRLYRQRVGWTENWELHLRLLTRRARVEQPLFDLADSRPTLALPYKRRRKID